MIRFFDILFSGLAIIVLLPFMLPIMIALKLTGEHDIFYAQMRVGRGGRDFPLLKFATMLRDSPNMPGGLFTQENDPRLLPLGKFLRRTKINELPQLINIFRGDMSVIGYRPMVRKHYVFYPPAYRAILETERPGLSGIGSVIFRDEEGILNRVPDREHFYAHVIEPYKAALECWYIQNRSLALYFRLIWMTVQVVLNPSANTWQKLKGLPEMPEELRPYLSEES